MSSDESTKSLTLFTRGSCPLCDHLVLALELLRPRYDFRYAKVDIDNSSDLTDLYATRIPVLVDNDIEICSGHCDPALVEAYLAQD